jgi:hypothetical protein
MRIHTHEISQRFPAEYIFGGIEAAYRKTAPIIQEIKKRHRKRIPKETGSEDFTLWHSPHYPLF